MAVSTDPLETRLDRIEKLVEKNAEVSARHEKELEKLEALFLQLSRDNLAIARTIIVTAGTVTILSPLLQAISPAIQTIVSKFVEAK